MASSTPTNVAVTQISTSSLEIRWTASNATATYTVTRMGYGSVAAGPYATNDVGTGLEKGTQYCYQLTPTMRAGPHRPRRTGAVLFDRFDRRYKEGLELIVPGARHSACRKRARR